MLSRSTSCTSISTRSAISVRTRVCVLAAFSSAALPSASVSTISPFLGPQDVATFERQLSPLLEEQNRQALQAAALAAKEKNAPLHARHLFVLCLAAARGEFRPALQWVQDVLNALTGPLKDVGTALAFVSAFCPHKYASIPASTNFLREIAGDSAFWSLFQPVDLTRTCRPLRVCIHSSHVCGSPMLATVSNLNFCEPLSGPLLSTLRNVMSTSADLLGEADLQVLTHHVLATRPRGEQFPRHVK